jgi:hypothetical protein
MMLRRVVIGYPPVAVLDEDSGKSHVPGEFDGSVE